MAEADDWKTIDDWRSTRYSVEVSLDTAAERGEWAMRLIDWGPKCEVRSPLFQGTRAEVVKQAAEWCRANDRAGHARNVERNLEMLAEMRAADEAGRDAD